MDHGTSPSGLPPGGGSGSAGPPPQRQKRNRVLLSCAPCRNSKLKCDRHQPCGQCRKKDRADLCAYAPKPERHKPPRGMAARLRRLEGMVRGMMDADGNVIAPPAVAGDGGSAGGSGSIPGAGSHLQRVETPGEVPRVVGQVVRGENAITYVGATHCLAMLEDIEDLKSYFDDPEDGEEPSSPKEEIEAPEMLLPTRGAPRNREELLSQLPDRQTLDRLINVYFNSSSPSQHVIHRPTFAKQYGRFWHDPHSMHLHWVAKVFMMIGVASFVDTFAPLELEGDSPAPDMDRIKHYRSCAGWALVWGKYMQPTLATLPAFLLYVEAHFIFKRSTQMNCYVLSGALIRMMLKMGLHRDPGKLANITPFEAEMRRRIWNMGIQIDLLVAFHMGLPSMLQGIETDTQIPRNLNDDDFGEESQELPPSRSESDYTSMTYANNKSRLLRVFAKVARQAHALAPPTHADIMRLDSELQEVWDAVPSIVKPRPLVECVGDAPSLVAHRFGLASLYNKCLCVLHRRYLGEAIPKAEHEYSRIRCLQGAMTLLDFQYTLWDARQPGHALSRKTLFVSSVAVHDFTLAAMVVYLVIQNEHSADDARDEFDLARPHPTKPTKAELRDLLKRAQFIWSDLANTTPEFRKTADTLATMLAKVGVEVDISPAATSSAGMTALTNGSSNESSMWSSAARQSSDATLNNYEGSLAPFGLEGSGFGQTPYPISQGIGVTAPLNFSVPQATAEATPSMGFDKPWMSFGDNMDWRYLDMSFTNNFAGGDEPYQVPTLTESTPLNNVDAMDAGIWNHPFGGNVSGGPL